MKGYNLGESIYPEYYSICADKYHTVYYVYIKEYIPIQLRLSLLDQRNRYHGLIFSLYEN